MGESQNLDPTALQRLERLGGRAFVGQMITLFLDYGGQKLLEARAAADAGNLAAVEKAVHPLKSSAGNVGASRVQELAAWVEELAQQGQGALLATPLAELEQAFAAVKPELEQRKQELSAQ
jgi:HPt (histidine-containing phosphotransfer) domain-containing protein